MSAVLAFVALVAVLAAAVARWERVPDWAVAAGAAALLGAGRLDLRRRRARRARGPRADGRVRRRAARAGGRLPPGRAVRLLRRRDGGRRPRPAAAAAGARVPGRRRHDRGAEPRRDDRPAHAGGVLDRRPAALQPAPARVRVHPPRQQRVAAAAGLEPDQPARVQRQRPVVHALRRADAAAVAGGDRDRVGGAGARVPQPSWGCRGIREPPRRRPIRPSSRSPCSG